MIGKLCKQDAAYVRVTLKEEVDKAVLQLSLGLQAAKQR